MPIKCSGFWKEDGKIMLKEGKEIMKPERLNEILHIDQTDKYLKNLKTVKERDFVHNHTGERD